MSVPPGAPLVAVKLTPVGRSQTFLPGDTRRDGAAHRRSRGRADGRGACGRHGRAPDPAARRQTAARRPTRRIASSASPTRDDIVARLKQQRREQEAYRIALLKIRERGLPMKLARVEHAFDGSRLLFYFTADGRVDFRELVRELATEFRMRIEMRQIGVRDEAKMLGGYGTCGRPLCCTTFLQSFEPISIKMAKQQDLSLNPSKLSGLCGRLEVLPAVRAAERQRRHARRLRQRRRLRQPQRMRHGRLRLGWLWLGGCGSCRMSKSESERKLTST